MKHHFLITVFFLFSHICNSQILNWAYNIGDPNYNNLSSEICNGLTQDIEGNLYITGRFYNNVNFNPHGIPFYLSSNITNNYDAYIAKYNSNFNLIWAINIGNSGNGIGISIKTDSKNNVYVCGNYIGNIDFDPSTNNYFLNSATPSCFLAKYNSNGQFEWVNDVGCNQANMQWFSGLELNVDTSSNILCYVGSIDTLKKFDSFGNLIWKKYLTGVPVFDNNYFFYTINNLKNTFRQSYPDSNIFNRIDINGNHTFSKTISKTTKGYISGFISYDQTGNILISGKFWGTSYFYGKNDTITILNYDSTLVYQNFYQRLTREFIAKIDTSGYVKWVKCYHSNSPFPYIIRTNSNGDIFTLGKMHNTINFDPSGNEEKTDFGYIHYIAKYDSSFNFLDCSLFLGGSGNDRICEFKLYNDSAIIAGEFYNTIDLDLTNSIYTLSTDPGEDIFVAKYSEFDIITSLGSVNELINSLNKISIYPNPSSGIFNINFNSIKNISHITISDIMGREIVSRNIDTNCLSINLSHYDSGVYFLRIFLGGESITKKIIIAR